MMGLVGIFVLFLWILNGVFENIKWVGRGLLFELSLVYHCKALVVDFSLVKMSEDKIIILLLLL